MKKIFTLAIVALMSVGAFAQVQFGAKVGFDLTNFWGEDVEHGMQANYQAGLTMEYRFTGSNFAIAPELVFASQGGKHDDITFTTNYINIPVMFKYYVVPSFSIDFGPQLGINVYSKVTEKTTGVKVKTDLDDITNACDFGLGLGGTYSLTSNAYLQARYTMGLTKAFDGAKAKNGNIQIAFGYKF